MACTVNTNMIGQVLHVSSYSGLDARSWCETGGAKAPRQHGQGHGPDSVAQKNMIERAREGEQSGLAVWTQDEAGLYLTRPMPAPTP